MGHLGSFLVTAHIDMERGFALWERALALDEALEHAIRSAEARDAIGPVWYRWPDIEPLQAHPRYTEVLARLRA
jgi:hypothetical protein